MKKLISVLVILFIAVLAANGQEDLKKMFEYSWETKDTVIKKSIREDILKQSPDSKYGLFCKGWFISGANEEDRSTVFYSKAISLDSSFWQAYINRGFNYLYQNKYTEALADYNKALEINPSFTNALVYRGDCYEGAKLTELAMADYNKAITQDSALALAYISRGKLYSNILKDYTKALEDYSMAINLEPKNEEAYNERANTYIALTDYSTAKFEISVCISLNPAIDYYYIIRGLLCEMLNEYSNAVSDYSEALRLNPSDSSAYKLRGNAFYNLYLYKEALSDYNTAIKFEPKDSNLYLSRAKVYIGLNDDKKAMADLNKFIELNSGNAYAYYYRAEVYKNTKEYTKAITDLNTAIGIIPDDYSIYVKLGDTYLYLKDYTKALTNFNTAIKLSPESDEAYFFRGYIYAFGSGDHSKAITDYLKAIETKYGKSDNLDDFCKKAQLVNYDSHRAMFESWNSKMWNKASGMLLWMSHPAWPSMVWQTYSWDFETFGSYFGSKKACEPLHIQLNLNDNKVVVINTSLKQYNQLNATLELYDLKGKKLFSKTNPIKVLADQLTNCFAAEMPSGLPSVYLLRLSLSEGNKVLSQNEYWKSNLPDGNFNEFNSLAEVHLAAKVIKQETGKVTFLVSNPTKSTTIDLKFNLRDPKSGKILLPANFSDGYFTLLPGEKKQMTVEWNHSAQKNPEVIVEGYNLKSQSLFMIR